MHPPPCFPLFCASSNMFSFYLTVFLPGVFVCLAVYLPELIPPQLLYKIEAAEKATPLPLFAEMLLVILILEVIREAGLRMPQSLGHSVSLVSALIIGDAAIATGLMSTPVIFVASITAIAVFVTPSLYEPATLLRLGVVLAAGLAGPVGPSGAFFCSSAQSFRHSLPAGAISGGASVPAAAHGRGWHHPPQLPPSFSARL